MPTISVKRRLLDKHLGQKHTREEIDELCFLYGLEVDDVIIETNSDGIDEEVFKIEVPANRYDLLCVEGLSKALLVFQQKIPVPKYEIVSIAEPRKIIIEPETAEVRPHAVGAILRGVSLDKDSYASFIELQDKLHQNICRKRTIVAIGTHDLDHVKGDVHYRALEPRKIVFKALNQPKECNAVELMTLFADTHLKEYLPILKDKKTYPVFYDEAKTVLSMPPIINGDKTKITLETKNIFIEATGTDLKKLEIVLDVLVTMFAPYCTKPYTIEPVDVVYPDGTIRTYPILEYRTQRVNSERMNSLIGIDLKPENVAELLTKMCLSGEVISDTLSEVEITIPPTRHDILHECDIAEDLCLAYGLNEIKPCLPQAHTVAEPLPLNKLTDQLRFNLAMAGWTEVMNFALCSLDDVIKKLRKSEQQQMPRVVKISNPKTSEFQVVRSFLLPGILKTLANNRDMPIPLKLFEVQDIVLLDSTQDTNARNERHLAAIFYSKTGGFEIIQGLLDRVMEILDVKFSAKPQQNCYSICETTDPTFFNGRCAEVLYGKTGTVLGIFGVLHPEVLANFNLNLPCAALEIQIEPLL